MSNRIQRIPLSISGIEDLRRKGFNQSQIADMHGVTRQAVSEYLKKYGGSLTPRQKVNEAWPWKTNVGHTKSKAYQNLRNHGEFMNTLGSASVGRGMNEDKLKRLKSWWKFLRDEDVVLEFDPEIPPSDDGVAPFGGFRYVPRESSDGDLLIRVNEHTNLTGVGMMLWSWPPEGYE